MKTILQEKETIHYSITIWFTNLFLCLKSSKSSSGQGVGKIGENFGLPVKRSYGSQDPWSSIAKKEERSGQSDMGIDRLKASDHYYHEQFMESFSSTNYSKLDDDRAWSFQEWKTEATTYDQSGRPDKTSWRIVQKLRPDHEEILLDGTAQSVRYGETLRDRSGQPGNIDSQEGAWLQQFVTGNDEAELELSVESRSFVNRVNDQVRKRQKNFQMLQKMYKNIL